MTTLSMTVDSIEDATASVTEAGGKVLQEKMPVPNMGWFATCEDTEGNKIGLWKDDPSDALNDPGLKGPFGFGSF